VLSYFLAVLAACANATSSVLQRKANKEVPQKENLSWKLIQSLLHQPVWYFGILAITVGFLLRCCGMISSRTTRMARAGAGRETGRGASPPPRAELAGPPGGLGLTPETAAPAGAPRRRAPEGSAGRPVMRRPADACGAG
jgi:hypothetical protein